MKFLFVLALALVIEFAAPQIIYRGNAKHPDYPDQCYYKEGEKALKFDETYKPVGECVKLKCRNDFVIGENHCSRYNVPAGCEEIKRDLTKTFPDCCTKLKCKDAEGKEVVRATTFESEM